MMKRQCLSCKTINEDDGITPDGLCFDCDQDKIEFNVEPSMFDEIVGKLAEHNSHDPNKGPSN
jgi:hypothetical protein